MVATHRSIRGSIPGIGAGVIAVLLNTGSSAAQELEPRAYSPSPTGTTFIAVTATRSAGGVFTDPSAPLIDVEAELGVLGLGVGHSFALLGKSALVLGFVPITWATASGQIGEDRRETSRRGLADPRVKLSMILAGATPMTRADFARAPRRTILGASLTVVPPLGQYDPAKLINLGSNRWSFKPEVGVSIPVRRWTLDTYAGVWVFTDNDRYYPGHAVRQQDTVVALQAHVSYTLFRRAWLAGDVTWYGGGQSTVDAAVTSDPFRNTRFGGTLAVPIGTRQSVKLAYSDGAATRFGADFTTITAGWQVLIF
jgi:outer membrane putative beta-barrel porin/alpha-amylase